MTLNLIVSLVFLAAVLLIAVKSNPQSTKVLDIKGVIFIVLGLALVLRFILGYFTVGFETDISCFKAWGQMANSLGYGELYYSDQFIDYPPGYIVILSLLDGIRGLFGIDLASNFYTLVIKLPSIISDLACGYLIYYISKKKIGELNSILISAIYLFCPAVLINSSIWGQADSYTTLLLLVSLMLLYKGHTIPSAIIYGIGVVSKPQILIFAPIYLFYTIFKKDFKGLILGLLSGFAAILLIATPFTKGFDYMWLINKYQSTIDYYSFYSINAYNLWDLFGLNWAYLPNEGIGLTLLNICGPVIATAFCGFFMFKAREDKKIIFAAPVVLMFSVFIFSVKMHERYLFPALLFVLLLYPFTKDKRFLYIFGGLSFVHFINVAYVLYLNNSFISNTAPEVLILSAAHVAIYIYTVIVLYKVFVQKKLIVAEPVAPENKTMDKTKTNKTRPAFSLLPKVTDEEHFDRSIKRKDVIIIAAVTLIYAFFAFYNLGDNKSAQTSWLPRNGESVVFSTEENYNSISYLPGIAGVYEENQNTNRVGCSFTAEVSDDGENWENVGEVTDGGVYSWQELSLEKCGKYFRITSTSDNTVLNEIGLKAESGDHFIILTAVSGNSSALSDEQNIVPLHSNYMNSSYFDEIYHARTAYEHILNVEPYENTHPPLGKYIISLGIMMFGMNPFGWRFMGTLFGVLMLPVFYHLLKRVLGGQFFPTVGVILFAFDFMHFTQTRIATIDTYAVFFILLMFDAMLVFIQKDFMKTKIKELLIPLLCSGIFFGLGAASKWTVIYGGAGLAVLLFGKFIRVGLTLKSRKSIAEFWRKTIHICMWCLLLFVAIPLGIYFCAFLPLTTLPQNSYNIPERFLSYQTHMFNYHSQLQATHYFASPWYEWPLDIRNIWYYSTNNFDGSGAVSTISCMGNPILWWTCLLALPVSVVLWFKERRDAATITIVGFLSVFLPWVLVPRLTFVYHYFTAVPFIILALMYVIKYFSTKGFMAKTISSEGILSKVPVYSIITSVFVIVIFVMFLAFYPAISGAPSTVDYIKGLQWMPNWYFVP